MRYRTLLITIPGFAKNENDTTCITHAQVFIRTLNKLYPKLQVKIVSLDYPYNGRKYKWHTNDVIPLNGRRLKSFLAPLKWLKIYSAIQTTHRKKDLIGILSFWCDTNAMVAHYFGKWNRVKHFCWIQGRDALSPNPALRFFRPGEHELIALSDFLQDEFYKNHSIKPFKVITAAIAQDELPNINSTERIIDIICVGSLIPLKQYGIFIHVVEQLKKTNPSLKAIICGEGKERKNIESLIQENALQKNIELKGELNHSKVFQLMCRSKLLLHTSSYEGYTRVCLEALAAGCHVISFVSPEKKSIPNWHIVSTKEEMISKSLEVLQLSSDSFHPVVPHIMEDKVRQMMSLYDYTE